MNSPVEYLTVTRQVNKPEYVFEVVLSDLFMEELSRDRTLGITFVKLKYKFLSDLADVLSDAILKELERLL